MAKRSTDPKIPFISVFSGAMGLDLGLEQAGFEAIAANDTDRASCDTIRANRPHLPVFEESVEGLSKARLGAELGRSLDELPLLAGGPPCQAFSVIGKRGGVSDSRGKLVFDFIDLCEELRPKTFLMENVRGLHSMPLLARGAQVGPGLPSDAREKGSLLREIFRRFEAIGYRVDAFLVNAVNYGAPQLRERMICIGNRFDRVIDFPEPQFSNREEDQLPPFRTLGEAIGEGFSDPDPDLMNFSPRKLSYLRLVPPGGNWRSLPEEIQKESMGKTWHLKGGRSAYWRKLSFDYPSPTVVTMPNHAGTSMCHPSELRALTAGECAAIQEFPRSWRFEGSTSEKYRQIGNAVPIRLGAVAGRVIKNLLAEIDAIERPSASRTPTQESRVVHKRPHVRTRSYWRNGKALAGNHDYHAGEKAAASS